MVNKKCKVSDDFQWDFFVDSMTVFVVSIATLMFFLYGLSVGLIRIQY